jgi:phasin family protein
MATAPSKLDERTAAGQGGRDSASNVADAARRTAEEAARAAREVGAEAAEAGQRVADAGVEVARRGADTVQQVFQSGMSVAARVAERSADQFARVWGFSGENAAEAAHQSRQNMEAIVGSSQVLTERFQDVSREWLGLAREQVERNLSGFDELLRCRSLQEFLAAQSHLARDNLEFMLNGSRRVAEMSAKISNEAAKKITAQAGHVARAAQSAAQRH